MNRSLAISRARLVDGHVLRNLILEETMKSLLTFTPEQLAAEVAALAQPSFRVAQILDWVYKKGATEMAAMSNLPAAIKQNFTVLTSRVVNTAESSDGTIKLLVELFDGARIECVMIPTEARATACVSSQAGCGMECAFCASGMNGLERNLAAGEILEQILHLQQVSGRRITHVVFMGMGEPLANTEAVIAAIHAIIDPARLGISARHVTLSTVGLPRQIRRLAAEELPITLAISLHAPNDALRRELMPRASQVPLEDVIAAAEEFYNTRHREITLEYVLLAGVNDTNICAEALARIASRLRCSVNLIRYNPVPSLPFDRPSNASLQAFADRLSKRGVNVQIRRPRGIDADAACGQLRRRVEEQEQTSPSDQNPPEQNPQ